MPQPRIGESTARPSYAMYEHRRLYVGFGFNDRDTVQVRLEPDNENVYLCYTECDGMRVHTATIPFDKFLDAVKTLVDSSR